MGLQECREVGLELLSRQVVGAALEEIGAAPDGARVGLDGLLGLALELQGALRGGLEGVKPGLLDSIQGDTLQQECRDGRDRPEVGRLGECWGSAHLPRERLRPTTGLTTCVLGRPSGGVAGGGENPATHTKRNRGKKSPSMPGRMGIPVRAIVAIRGERGSYNAIAAARMHHRVDMDHNVILTRAPRDRHYHCTNRAPS